MKRLLFTSFLITLTFSFVFAQNVISLKRNSTNGKDASVWNNNPNGNYGNSKDLTVYTWTNSGSLGIKRSFLEFDLSQLPNSIVVDSAYLNLYYDTTTTINFQTHSGINAMEIKRVTGSWTENGITWNNQPSTTDSNKVTVPEATNNTQDYRLSVGELVKDMLNNTNHGFMIKMLDEINYYRATIIASSEHASIGLRPELVVHYHLTTGIQSIVEKFSDVVTLFPNPASDFINLKFKRGFNQSDYIVSLIDLTGKEINVNVANSSIDVSGYSKGIYFLKITDKTGVSHINKVIIK